MSIDPSTQKSSKKTTTISSVVVPKLVSSPVLPYLLEKDLQFNVGELRDFLIQTDTYNESRIREKVLSFTPEKIIILVKIAIHFSIIGYGGQSYGSIKDSGNVLEVERFMRENGILYKSTKNAKLQEDDITPRRLVRFFRYHIQNYIKDTNTSSYLWRKYSDLNPETMFFCFPGAEHVVLENNAAKYLYSVYINLDKKLNTTISQRIQRVFQARGIIVP